MAQEKILGNQLNITSCASELNSEMVTVLSTDTAPQLGGGLDTYGYGLSASKGNFTISSVGNVDISTDLDFNIIVPDRQVCVFSAPSVAVRGWAPTGSPSNYGEGLVRLFQSTTDGDQPLYLRPSASMASATDFVFPSNHGNSGDVLETDGFGTTSWAAPSGGGYNWLTANNGVNFTYAPSATGINTIALGPSTSAIALEGIAIGNYATVGYAGSPITGEYGIAIGTNARSHADSSIAIGEYAYSNNAAQYSTVIGGNSYATHSKCVTLGTLCASGAYAQTNIGYGVQGDGNSYTATLGYGAGAVPGGSVGQNLVTIYGDGKCQPYGDEAMFVAPPYLKVSLPTAVAGGMIYVSDAVTGHAGSPASRTGVNCMGAGSPPEWIDMLTGLPVA